MSPSCHWGRSTPAPPVPARPSPGPSPEAALHKPRRARRPGIKGRRVARLPETVGLSLARAWPAATNLRPLRKSRRPRPGPLRAEAAITGWVNASLLAWLRAAMPCNRLEGKQGSPKTVRRERRAANPCSYVAGLCPPQIKQRCGRATQQIRVAQLKVVLRCIGRGGLCMGIFSTVRTSCELRSW